MGEGGWIGCSLKEIDSAYQSCREALFHPIKQPIQCGGIGGGRRFAG